MISASEYLKHLSNKNITMPTDPLSLNLNSLVKPVEEVIPVGLPQDFNEVLENTPHIYRMTAMPSPFLLTLSLGRGVGSARRPAGPVTKRVKPKRRKKGKKTHRK